MLASVAPVAMTATLVAGCGGGGIHDPRLSSLPLVPGSHVSTNVRRCDQGSNPYCAIQFVLVDSHYPTSRALMLAERDVLHSHGWTGTSPQAGEEFAAESPGHKLRVAYSTPYGDLEAIDLGEIERVPQVARSLAMQLFNGTPAISVELLAGSE